jgi:uncharacterized membrane protein
MESSPTPRQAALRIPLIALLACFGVLWLLAVVGISRDMTLPIDERWAGSGMLVLEGSIAVLWAAYAAGWRIAFRFAAATIILAYLIERFGVRTGVIFGHYTYTGLLVPRLPGGVPLPIACAWLLSALGAVAIARRIAPFAAAPIVITVAALLSALLDACIEPTAAFIKGYWRWQEGGIYYGVPAHNFLGWFVAGLVINAVVLAIVWRGGSLALDIIPMTLFEATVAMFAIIALFRGYPLATLIGAIVCVGTLLPIIRAAHRPDGSKARSAAPSIPHTRASATTSSSPAPPRSRAR